MRIFKIGIVPMLYKIRARYFSFDKEMNDIASRAGTYHYLKRYRPQAKMINWQPELPPRKYWTFWAQGEDVAPAIVKTCLSSMRRHLTDGELYVLSLDDVSSYVTVPSFIEEKFKRGIISITHYSDIVRLLLLQKYGGVWIDSTILLTGPIPVYVMNHPIFLYRVPYRGHVIVSNNFISSAKGHPLVEYVLELLLNYWAMENRLVSYSIMQLAFSHAIETYPFLWNDLPYYSSELEDQIVKILGKPFSEARFTDICALSPIHKLTYKTKQFGIDPDEQGTFYDVISKGLDE